MKEKTKLVIWIIVDLLLLIGVIGNTLYWWDTAQSLKAPCVKCARDNEALTDCLNTPRFPYVINLSELEFENKKINNSD